MDTVQDLVGNAPVKIEDAVNALDNIVFMIIKFDAILSGLNADNTFTQFYKTRLQKDLIRLKQAIELKG